MSRVDDPDSLAAAPDGQTHPWRRFFARSMDGVLAALGIGLIITMIAPSWFDQPDIVFAAPLYLGWAALETAMLSITGTTPARWLFGIRVVAGETNRPLPLARSLHRTAIMWVAGLGLTIPLVTLLTQGMAYHRLKTTGTTLWDSASNAVVTHTEWSAARAIICTVCTTVVLGAIVVLSIYSLE